MSDCRIQHMAPSYAALYIVPILCLVRHVLWPSLFFRCSDHALQFSTLRKRLVHGPVCCLTLLDTSCAAQQSLLPSPAQDACSSHGPLTGWSDSSVALGASKAITLSAVPHISTLTTGSCFVTDAAASLGCSGRLTSDLWLTSWPSGSLPFSRLASEGLNLVGRLPLQRKDGSHRFACKTLGGVQLRW